MPEIKIVYNTKICLLYDLGGYESRNQSTMSLLLASWKMYYRGKGIDTFQEKTIWTDDHFNPEKSFSYATSYENFQKAIPDHVFFSWPQVGIHNYESVFNEVILKSKEAPKDMRIFWRGAPNPIRKMAEAISVQFPDYINIRCFEWSREDKDKLYLHTQEYRTLPEHCTYGILIDLPGAGYSGRLPLLLATGRPVIIVGRPNEQWFYWDDTFKPWVHYIPCGSKDGNKLTPHDIFEACKWTIQNPVKAADIGLEGQKYALSHFTYNAIVKKIGQLLK